MNKFIMTLTIFFTGLFSVEIYWDLGVGITDFSPHYYQDDLQASTYHRVEGLKKYYDMDYEGAIFHFEKINSEELINVSYEYIDCYYSLGFYNKALSLMEPINEQNISENLIYLKSKIFLKLNLLSESLNCLSYLKTNYPNSDYNEILLFEIDKINLRNNE